MKIKSILFAGLLSIFTLCVASAKTYDISLGTAVKAGSLELKAGNYQLKLDGNKVTFVDVKSQKHYTTEGKIENVDKSYPATAVEASTEGGTTVVKDIQLGGSKIKIDF